MSNTVKPVSFVLSFVLLPCLSQATLLEPPKNPYLADSVWPMTHRNPYNQASSPHRGIEVGDKVRTSFKRTIPASITLAYSNNYESTGKPVVWGTTLATVFKMDLDSYFIKKIDYTGKALSENGISGAYTLVDLDNYFYVPVNQSLHRYGDKKVGNPKSDIELKAVFEIPAELLIDQTEHIVGINMSYDGQLVVATSMGLIMSISRDFSEYQSVRLGENEEVSNSFAIDEDGGIFVVTNRAMHRVQWDGDTLIKQWRAEYETGPDQPWPGRLGTGSGSTPTLMGLAGEDKFVVFTDGGQLMNLVLMWRDEIPAGWQPIAPGKDVRIAAEMPITFGKPDREKSISEQSVLVRGHSALVVNNEYGWDTSALGGNWGMVTVLFSNWPGNAPYGVERFSWHANTQQLQSDWSNQLSCPNGIPTMSEASNLAYCWGQRNGKWMLEGMDWETGESRVTVPMGYLNKYNSTYAATQVVNQGQVVSGTFGGVVRLSPK